MLADIDLGRHPPIGGSDSGTRIEFYQLTVGIQTSSFNMLRPGLYPSLCPKMVEIGPVVLEILIFCDLCVGRSCQRSVSADVREAFFGFGHQFKGQP